MQPEADRVDPETFARSVRALLNEDPRRYRNFGVYWYLVKAVLKRFYDRQNLYLLGDYEDRAVIDRMPQHATLGEALAAAIEEYQHNVSFNLGLARIEDADGETLTLHDPDAE